MAANLPELYKNNVGPAGDRQEKERDVLYTALMPLKWEFTTKRTDIISIMLVRQDFVYTKMTSFSTNWQTRVNKRPPASEIAEQDGRY